MKTKVRPVAVDLHFLPVRHGFRWIRPRDVDLGDLQPRVAMTVTDGRGKTRSGVGGETPLSVQWSWPSTLSYQQRCDAMQDLCVRLAEAWGSVADEGHPIELGHRFIDSALPSLLTQANVERDADVEPMPWLAALVCSSAFDIAVHDAYGQLLGLPVYSTYGPEFMNVDLSHFLGPAPGATVSFAGECRRITSSRRPRDCPPGTWWGARICLTRRS